MVVGSVLASGSTQSKYLDDKYYFRQTRSRHNIYTALVGLRTCDGWDSGIIMALSADDTLCVRGAHINWPLF